MSKPDPLVKGSNFDDVLRGMAQTPGRSPKPSYNFLVIMKYLFRVLIKNKNTILNYIHMYR